MNDRSKFEELTSEEIGQDVMKDSRALNRRIGQNDTPHAQSLDAQTIVAQSNLCVAKALQELGAEIRYGMERLRQTVQGAFIEGDPGTEGDSPDFDGEYDAEVEPEAAGTGEPTDTTSGSAQNGEAPVTPEPNEPASPSFGTLPGYNVNVTHEPAAARDETLEDAIHGTSDGSEAPTPEGEAPKGKRGKKGGVAETLESPVIEIDPSSGDNQGGS